MQFDEKNKVLCFLYKLLDTLPKGSVNYRWVLNPSKRRYFYYYLKYRDKEGRQRSLYLGKADRGLTQLVIQRNRLRQKIRELIHRVRDSNIISKQIYAEIKKVAREVENLVDAWQKALMRRKEKTPKKNNI